MSRASGTHDKISKEINAKQRHEPSRLMSSINKLSLHFCRAGLIGAFAIQAYTHALWLQAETMSPYLQGQTFQLIKSVEWLESIFKSTIGF